MRQVSGNAPPHIAIIGGGLAGLAAASALSVYRCQITLFESRQTLGGRASSFLDPETGDVIDNCQHVTMGCCTELARFCELNGLGEMLAKQRTLYFSDEQGTISRLPIDRFPSPLHFVRAFLRMNFLSWKERIRVAWGMLRLRMVKKFESGSFLDWLKQNRQTQRTIDRFWNVVLTSALNETLDRIDFRYARQVIVEGFLRDHQAPVVEIPIVSLSDLYGDRLRTMLESRGVTFRFNAAASKFAVSGDRVDSLALRSNESISAEAYLLAVPPQRVADLFDDSQVRQRIELSNLSQFEYSPITSVHMWFDRVVMVVPNLAVVGKTIQWLFAKQRPSDGSGRQYLQAVISASRDLSMLGREKIAEQILKEVMELLPRASQAKLLRSRVVTERHATFSILPGIDKLRPLQKTSITNLWLAGDYTQSGWPATMEGAVRSGNLAAQQIANELHLTRV